MDDAEWLRLHNMAYGFPADTAANLERIAARLRSTGELRELLSEARQTIAAVPYGEHPYRSGEDYDDRYRRINGLITRIDALASTPAVPK